MDSRTIFGLLGNITAFITFLVPARMINKIRLSPSGRSPALSRSIPYQYHAAIVSCGLWVLYGGGVHRDKFLVIINVTGIIMHIVYLTVLIRFSRTCMGMMQNYFKHYAIVLIELSSLYVLARMALIFHDPVKFAGAVCATGTTFISIMRMLCDPKSAPFVYEFVAMLANGAIWTVYAVIQLDTFILVPNVVGMVHGLGQLVYAIRYRSGQNQRQTAEEISPMIRTTPDLPEP